jgi:superfamily II DNA or RNA helicase
MAKQKRIILVVPNIGLVNQMLSDFKEYGWDNADEYVSLKYHGKKIDMEKPMLITTWQSVYKYPEEFFKTFDGLIIDEVHGAGTSKNILNISKMCSCADYRIGFTGTMPEEGAETLTINGYLGPVLYDLGAKKLIDDGVLSKIQINNLILKYPEHVCMGFDNYNDEVDYIISNKNRNESIDFIVNEVPETDNIIFLMQRVEHLKATVEYFKKNFPNREVYQIYGGVEADERERIRKLIESKNGAIIIATYKTMSTGVNIKKLHHVVFFSSYKAKITILQSIGRGLRTHETKSKVQIWDVVDDMRITTGPNKRLNYSYKHFKSRLNYYKEEGFAYNENIITLKSRK